jgi:DNA-binding GntR family transcriptional regulator
MSNNRLFHPALDSPAGPPRSTRASAVADDLRMKIMSGALAPDVHLRVQALADTYAMALSPIREALNRLASEGLVLAHDMRGFFVAPVSEKELQELTRTRCWLNEIALRESIASGGQDWEERLLVAYHRLARIDRRDPSGAANPDWNEAHRTFHRALTDGCGSSVLIDFCDQLFVQAERYRNLSRQSPNASALQRDDEHRSILESALERDYGRTIVLLNRHFIATAELCGLVLQQLETGTKATDRSETLQ